MKKPTVDNNLEKLIAIGKQKGFLTYDEVNDVLPDEVTSSDEIDQLFELLNSQDIQIIDSVPPEELNKEDSQDYLALKGDAEVDLDISERDYFIPLDDPVKMYLKQMGRISLLTREDEIRLAKKIETTELKFRQVALSTKFVKKHIVKTVEEIVNKNINIEDVVKDDIQIKKEREIRKFARLLKKLKSTKDDQKIMHIFQELNLSTSVIENIINDLSKILKELDYLDRELKKKKGRKPSVEIKKLILRKRKLLSSLCGPYKKIREQFKIIRIRQSHFTKAKQRRH